MESDRIRLLSAELWLVSQRETSDSRALCRDDLWELISFNACELPATQFPEEGGYFPRFCHQIPSYFVSRTTLWLRKQLSSTGSRMGQKTLNMYIEDETNINFWILFVKSKTILQVTFWNKISLKKIVHIYRNLILCFLLHMAGKCLQTILHLFFIM